MGRKRYVRPDVQAHQKIVEPCAPVPEGTSILDPQVEEQLRAAGLRITGLHLRPDGTPESIRFTDTRGEEKGLADVQAFADKMGKVDPMGAFVGAMFAEALFTFLDPNAKKQVRGLRALSHGANAALRHVQRPKAQGAQDQGQGEPKKTEPPPKGPLLLGPRSDPKIITQGSVTCILLGHARCVTCRRCTRRDCKDICTCSKRA